MRRVIHFEIQADHPERAVRFYSALLHWNFTKWAGPVDYWLIETVGGEPVIGFVSTVDVDSVDDTLVRATELGGTLAVPKMPIPGVGWLAYLKDTEENVFGVMQHDPAAA